MISLFEEYPQLKIIQDLSQSRRVKIYLVGGFLRDLFLGRPCLDFDFTIEKGAIDFARNFARRIKGVFVLLDEQTGCARVVKKHEGKSLIFDFADFRVSNLRVDLAHRDFTINTLCVDLEDLKEDRKPGGTPLPRFNAAGQEAGCPPAALPEFQKIIRDFKGGQKDLKSKTIRMVSPKAFQEDPLRLLRAFSLRAVTGFKIDSKTLAQIKKNRGLLKDVSAERIRDEFFKILASNRAFENLKMMDQIGLLEEVIPQVRVMFQTRQGGYHHLDVWPHSLETVRQLEKILQEIRNNENRGTSAFPCSLPGPPITNAGAGTKSGPAFSILRKAGLDFKFALQENAEVPGQSELNSYLNERLSGTRIRRDLLKLAALLHDIGKPDTQKQEKDRMSFHGHEHVGASIVRSIARMLRLSVRERHRLEDMVRWHLRPGYLSNFRKPSERSIFRYFRDTKEEAVSILLLSLADQRATRGPLTTQADQKHHEIIIRTLIDRYFEIKRQQPFVRLINGHDLIKKLKLKPSPLFAKILQAVEEQQTLGKIQSKEEALALAQKIAEKAP